MSLEHRSSGLNCEVYRAGALALDCGEVLQDAFIAYKTFGSLDADRTNVIIVPTHFGGTHENSTYLIGKGRALDPDKYFIVIPNLLGNGVSSSPTNALPGGQGSRFPRISINDNVRLQYKLLTEGLGVRQIELAVGFSMGAVQVFHWAALFPAFVRRLAPICGGARISVHNFVFLEGMKAALTADPAWNEGAYTEPPLRGQRAMALAWAAWPPSAHFYRRRLFTKLGYDSIEDFLDRYWAATYCAMDANNLLCQLHTWQSADISNNALYGGDFDGALAAISARSVVMPCVNDAYFPPEDSILEVAKMPNAQLRPIRSFWGHWAGSGRNPEDTAFIDRNLRELLAD
jgi:homoserine O-acetyltransferase